MDALVVTPDDGPVSLSWQLCAYVKSADAKRACPGKGVLEKGKGETFRFTIDGETAERLEPLCGGRGDLVDLLPDGVAPPECTEDGYPLMVRMVAKTAKEEAVAVKRVMVLAAPPNRRLENPVILGFDNVPESVHAGETYAFTIDAEGGAPPLDDDGCGDVDDGGVLPDAGPAEATASPLRYSWFLRGGDPEYLDDRKDALDDEDDDLAARTFFLKTKKGAKRVTVWAVVRDDEVGVDWRRLDFDVTSP